MLEDVKVAVKRLAMVSAIYRLFREMWWGVSNHALKSDVADIRDSILQISSDLNRSSSRNPLNSYGRKCFSQTDEDGITLEILKRIGCLDVGVFAEFGVGNGMENNTLILAALGWRGFWVGGEALAYDLRAVDEIGFAYLRDWVMKGNILDLARKGMGLIRAGSIDVVSLDLDGNDLCFVRELLGGGGEAKIIHC